AGTANANNLQITTGPSTFETLDMSGAMVKASGVLSLSLSSFFSVNQVGFGLEKSVQTVTLTDGRVVSVDMLAFGFSNVTGFLGLNGGTADAAGLDLSGVNASLVLMSDQQVPSSRWTALKGSATSASLVGVPGLTAAVNAVSISVNLANSAGVAVNFAAAPYQLVVGSSTVTFDMHGVSVNAAATLDVNLFGFAILNGSFAIQQKSVAVNLSDGTRKTVDMLTIGASNINGFVGINGNDLINRVGFQVTGVDVAVALMTEQGNPQHRFTAVQASATSAAFVGLPKVSISSTNMSLEINKGYLDTVTGKTVVVDFAANNLAVATGPSTFYFFTMPGAGGELLRASGIFDVNVFDALVVNGSFRFETTTQDVFLRSGATPTTNLSATTRMLTMSGYVGTAFVGMNAGSANPVGFSVTGLNVALAMMTDVNDGARSWAVLKAKADSISMNASGIKVAGSNIDIGINLEAGDGTTVDLSRTNIAIAPAPTAPAAVVFDIAPSVGSVFEISGVMSLDILNFYQATDRFSFRFGFETLNVVDAAGVTTTKAVSSLKLSRTGISAFAGVSGVGVDLKNVSFALALVTDGSHLWASLKATADQVSFKGINDVTISASNVSVALNSVSLGPVKDGSSLDYSAATGKSLAIPSSSIVFDTMKGETYSISGTMNVNLFGFFSVSGQFSFNKSVRTVDLLPSAGGMGVTGVSVEGLTLIATNVDAFVGINANSPDRIGFSATGVDFALMMLTDTANKLRSWTALKANASSIAFKGIPGVNISGTNISVSLNMASPDGFALDFSNPLTLPGLPSVTMDMTTGNLLSLKANMNIDLLGFYQDVGLYSFKKRFETVVLNDGSTASVDMLTLSDTVNTTVFAGVNKGTSNEFGFNLVNPSFGIALISDMFDRSRYWVTAQAKTDALNFVGIDGLTMQGKGVDVRINTAAKDGTVINYDVASGGKALTIPSGLGGNGYGVGGSGNSFTFDINGSQGALIQVSVANALLTYKDFLHVSGSFAFTKQTAGVVMDLHTGLSNDPSQGNFAGLLSPNDLQAVVKLASNSLTFADIANASTNGSLVSMVSSLSNVDVLHHVAMDSVTMAGSNINVFVGSGPYFQDSNNDGVYNFSGGAITIHGVSYPQDTLAANAMGFQLTNAAFAYASYNISASNFSGSSITTATLPTLKAIKVTASSVGLVGLDFLKLSASSISFEMNGGTPWVMTGTAKPTPWIDFKANFGPAGLSISAGGTASVPLDYSGTFMRLMARGAELQISQFVYVSGDFAFTKGNPQSYTVTSKASSIVNTLPAGPVKNAVSSMTSTMNLDAITIGASNVNMFVGMASKNADGTYTPYYGTGSAGNAVGLYMGGVDFAYAMLNPNANNFVGADQLNLKFSALKASAATAGLVGLGDVLTVKLENILVELNQGSSSSVPQLDPTIDFTGGGATPNGLAVSVGGGKTINLDFSGAWIRASVNYAELNVGGFLQLVGSLAFTKGATREVTYQSGDFGTIMSQVGSSAVLPDENAAKAGRQMSVDTMTIGGSGLFGFAGVGPYYSDTNGDGRITSADNVDTSAIGVAVTNSDFGIEVMTPSLLAGTPVEQYTPKFVSAKVSVGSASLVGMGSYLTATMQKVEININTAFIPGLPPPVQAASLLLNMPFVDFSPGATGALAVPTGTTTPDVMLDFSSEILQIKVGYAAIDVAGILQLNAGMSFTKKGAETVTLTDGSTRTVLSLSLAITNAYGFIGMGSYWQWQTDPTTGQKIYFDAFGNLVAPTTNAGAVGIAIQNLNLGATFMRSSKLDIFFAAQVDLSSAGLVGINGVTLNATSLMLDINQAISAPSASSGTVVDFSKSSYKDVNGVTHTGGYLIETSPGVGILLQYNSALTRVAGQGTLAILGMASITGSFEFKQQSLDLSVFVSGSAVLGPSTFHLASMNVVGVLALRGGADSGLALKMTASRTINIGSALSLNASYTITMNTTGKDFVYQVPPEFTGLSFTSVTVPAQPPGVSVSGTDFVYIEAKGSLDVMNGLMTMNGDFNILLSPSAGQSKLTVSATVDLPVVNPLSVTGTLGITTTGSGDGVFGSLQIGAATGVTLIQAGPVTVDGRFLLQFNTTSSSQNVRALDKATGGYKTVALAPSSLHVAGFATIDVSGFTTLHGSFDLTVSSGTLDAMLDMSLSMGAFGSVGISGGARFVTSTGSVPAFVLDVSSTLNINVGPVSASGTVEVQINTGATAQQITTNSGSRTVQGNTYAIYLGTSATDLSTGGAGAGSLSVFGFTMATFGGHVGVSNGLFTVTVDQAGIDFVGLAYINFTGYFRSDGQFSLTGSAGFSMSGGVDFGIFGASVSASATLSVTIGTTGIAMSASGSVRGTAWAGWDAVKVAGVTIIPAVHTSITLSLSMSASIALDWVAGTADVSASVGFSVAGKSASIPLSFSFSIPAIPPTLGTLNAGVLTLDPTGGDYVVSSAGGGVIKVTKIKGNPDGTDLVQTFSGVSQIDGSAGNENITVDPGVGALTINTKGGDDKVVLNGGAGSTVNTGAGDDTIVSSVAGTFSTGSGNDLFDGSGAAVNQTIDMGTGNNRVKTGSGTSTITLNGGRNSVTGNGSVNITNTREGSLDVALTGSGSNLAVTQSKGRLNIGTLSMGGGSITLNSTATSGGGIVVDSTAGSASSTVMSTASGDLLIKQVGVPNSMTGLQSPLADSAIGTLGATSLSAAKGMVTAKLDATTLSVTAQGDVNITDINALTLNSVTLNPSSAGANVNITTAGALQSNATIATTGGAVIRLTSSGLLTLNGALTTNVGAVTLTGVGVTMTAAGDITSTRGDVTIDAGSGALTMNDGTRVDAGAGVIKLDASGTITVGKLRTTNTSDFLITSTGGAILDAGDTAYVDIDAAGAKLVLSAAAGIGSTGALESTVGSLTVTNSTSGSVAITETDNLLINILTQSGAGSVTLSTLNGAITVAGAGMSATSGKVTLHAQGANSSMRLNGKIRTAGGGIALTTDQGDLTFAAGLQVVGSGNIDLTATNGAIVKDRSVLSWLMDATGKAYSSEIPWLVQRGKISVDVATGRIVAANLLDYEAASHVPNGTELRAAGGVYLQTSGSVSMSAADNIGGRASTDIVVGETAQQAALRQKLELIPLSFVVDSTGFSATSSKGAPVSVLLTGNVAMNAAGLTGGTNMTVYNLAGTQSVVSPVQGGGQNITLRASDISITAPIQSVGADLLFQPIDPSQAIVIGDVSNPASYANAYTVFNSDLANLRDGFTHIIFGSELSRASITVGDTALVGGQVSVTDPLVLRTPLLGGGVTINSRLVGTDDASLTIDGSGHTTVLNADVSMGTDIKVNDSVVVNGNITLTAGNSGVGNSRAGGISLGNSIANHIDGNAAGAADSLNLVARNAAVMVDAQVGVNDPLAGLTVTGATDVTFAGTVNTIGDVVVHASGVVTFDQALNISNGNLTVVGASRIVFKQGVTVGGNIMLTGNEIDFLGGQSTVGGSGTLTLRPATPGIITEVGTLQSGSSPSALNLTTDDLLALRQGFSSITIGYEAANHHAQGAAGNVRIGSVGSAHPTFLDHVRVFGNRISVEDYSLANYTLRAAGDVTLDAAGDIVIANQTDVGGGLNLYSATGSVVQVDSLVDGLAQEPLSASSITVSSQTGTNLGALDTATLDVTNRGSGDVVLRLVAASSGASITNVSQTAPTGGNVSITSDAGVLTISGSGVHTAGSGSISISADGAGGMLQLSRSVVAQGGAITLSSSGAVVQSAGVTTLGGQVTVTAGGTITMADGVVTKSSSVGGAGNIQYTAAGDIVLSQLEAPGTISVSSTSGGIVD
ncbi:MAG: hypothetical protein D6786_03210, partial [Gammaproteobacteria bacterium]